MAGAIYAVVLAGGSGTRFWPASRKARPKQLMALAPGSSEALIAATVRRLAPVVTDPAQILIATSEPLLEATRAALPTLPEASFLGEPMARNTAPCIAWATQLIAERDPAAIVVVVPSDHHIVDEGAFARALVTAIESARTGVITTIGVEPTRPETGYGYIEVAEPLGPSLHRVARFVEKPSREIAAQYLASGSFLWNAGYFIFRADVMLAAIAKALPPLARALERLDGSPEAVRAMFALAPAVSIDVGVMEKTTPLHVVPAKMGWSDLGSWGAAWELSPKDAHDNAAEPGTVAIDARGNLVRAVGERRRLVALVGVEDLCIIETDDALLIMPRERAQDVREVVATLEAAGRTDLV
jgi:mannose-1-phosphate guanylyltransferase